MEEYIDGIKDIAECYEEERWELDDSLTFVNKQLNWLWTMFFGGISPDTLEKELAGIVERIERRYLPVVAKHAINRLTHYWNSFFKELEEYKKLNSEEELEHGR